METKNAPRSPGIRLQKGAVVLAAAQMVETKAVKDSLEEFKNAHRSYSDAQAKADRAAAEVRAAKAELAQIEAEQDEAIEELARCLIADRQPRGKPFSKFNAAAPGVIVRLAFAAKAQAVHALTTAVQDDASLSSASRKAAANAEKVAVKLEATLAPIDALRNGAQAARQQRDQIAQLWDNAFSELRHAARAANRRVPGLYIALFGRPVRSTKKTQPEGNGQSTATPSPQPAPAVASNG